MEVYPYKLALLKSMIPGCGLWNDAKKLICIIEEWRETPINLNLLNLAWSSSLFKFLRIIGLEKISKTLLWVWYDIWQFPTNFHEIWICVFGVMNFRRKLLDFESQIWPLSQLLHSVGLEKNFKNFIVVCPWHLIFFYKTS